MADEMPDAVTSYRLGKLERIGPDVAVPQGFKWRWQRAGDHPIEMTIKVERGKASVESLRIDRERGRPGLSASELRRLPLTSLVEHAVASAALMHRGRGRFARPTADDLERVAVAAKSATTRQRITDERLREAAEAYTQLGGRIDEVAARLYLSRPQTFRLLSRAREAGYLTERQR